MFTADLLHDETAEIERLSRQVASLDAELIALRVENAAQREVIAEQTTRGRLRQQVWDWFRDGGPADDDTRDQVAGQVCRTFLSPGSSDQGLVTAAAVCLAESQPSGLSDAEVVSAAVACRQVVTQAELTQARLTQELAWRYQARHPEELDLNLDTRLPEWVRDVEQRALAAAIEEVAALARTSPAGLRARVAMIATWPDEHPTLYRALIDGTITTTRARLIARETEKLDGPRERAWVEGRVLPYAEQVGEAGLRNRLERLIAQADPARYRKLLDDAARERDAVTTRQQGYGRAALTYQGTATSVAELRAALTHRAAAANPDSRGAGSAARDQRAMSMADVLHDLVTDPATMPGGLLDQGSTERSSATAATAPASPSPTSPTSPAPPTSPTTAPGTAVRVEPSVCLNVTLPFQVLAALWQGQPTPTAFGLIELDGHGPIPARALAGLLTDYGARAIWRCQVLDDRPGSPTRGQVIGLGRASTDPSYRPSPSVTALVRGRRHRCSFPGCRRPAIDCDLDHVIAHSAGGATSEANLAPLCRHHHLLKHHGGFTPELDPITGQISWRTPSGHRLTEPPDVPPPLAADGDLPGAWPTLPPDDPPF